MRRKRLLWHLFFSYFLLTLCSLVVVIGGAWWSLRQFYFSQTEGDLRARARMAAIVVGPHLTAADMAQVDARCKELAASTDTRITIILPSGRVIGDSHHDPRTMENHRDRPEVRQALVGRPGVSTRDSATLHEGMMYVAVPVRDGRQLRGVVRAAIPLTSYGRALQTLHAQLLWEVVAAAMVFALVSLAVSRRISRPLEDARRAARRFAEGDLQGRLPVYGSDEVAGLTAAMNEMACQLDERIRTIVRQRTEQEAVLLSMVEGVLAVDNDERLLRVNQAGARLLGINPVTAQGRSIQEVVRNIDLQRFVAKVLASREPQETEITLRQPGEQRFMQLHGTLLRGETGERIGALVVMNDITHIRRLETVRRDFVANVSHELRTPITSIKGFVETLLDGSLQEPEEAERFLRIIARHTDRLAAIIDDLLTLSRMEQQESALALEPAPIRGVVDAAVQACELKAQEKQIAVSVQGERDLTAPINPPLLEQAVVNLIDNAIKYSPPASQVVVELAHSAGATAISVRDQGCGIADEHLPRIFERFYRVDTGRSRKLGGTGLGLAIVKHIMQAHHGRVTVESVPGQGSTFTIHLPHAG